MLARHLVPVRPPASFAHVRRSSLFALWPLNVFRFRTACRHVDRVGNSVLFGTHVELSSGCRPWTSFERNGIRTICRRNADVLPAFSLDAPCTRLYLLSTSPRHTPSPVLLRPFYLCACFCVFVVHGLLRRNLRRSLHRCFRARSPSATSARCSICASCRCGC